MEQVKSKSYTLKDDNGHWLGQIVLTSDGLIASVTDWGNLSFAWRSFGKRDFREFLCELNVGYFGDKMFSGIAYIAHSKKVESACRTYAEKILPALQKTLKTELENGIEW